MEPGRVVGGEPGIRPFRGERPEQDRLGEPPVIEQVAAGEEGGQQPGTVDRDPGQQDRHEPALGSREAREALSYTPGRSRDAAADRQVAGHAPCWR